MKVKLSYKCPFCGNSMFSINCDEARKSDKTFEEIGLCMVINPPKDKVFCDIFCYFACSKRKIYIGYEKILNSLGIQFEKGSMECSTFNKMYQEAFNKISSSVPIIGNGFKIQERIS